MDFVDQVKDFVTEKVADMPIPEASCTDVDLKDVSTAGVAYLAKVAVKNPYSVSIPICDIEYCLKSADRAIVEGHVPDPGSLVASETTMVDVNVNVPHSVLASLVQDIAGDWDIDYEIVIKLIVDLPVMGKFTIPINQKGEMKLPTWRDMFWGGGGGAAAE